MLNPITAENTQFEFHWLGQLDYPSAHAVQLTAMDSLRGAIAPHGLIYGLEHPPVVTIGRHADPSKEILADNLPVHNIDRGGQATVHSPGQLVIYPIVDLRRLNLGVKDWVQTLLEVSASTLKKYGLSDLEKTEDGVFTGRGKIVSVGLRIDQGISRHGLAMNVSNDLALFKGIRVCGVAERPVDRLADYHFHAKPEEVFAVWRRELIDFLRAQS